MNINQFRAFCFVVEEKSFSRAARRMFVSQPALSMQIKSLEGELGEPLFDRNNRMVLLTDGGEIFYEHVKRIFEEIDSARHQIDEIRELSRGHLRIACSDTVSKYYLLPILSDFLDKHPGIELTVHNKTTQQIVKQVLDMEVDIGLATMPVSHVQLSEKPIFGYHDVAVCKPSHSLAKRSAIDLMGLSQIRLLLLEPGTKSRSLIDQAFINSGCAPGSVMELGSVEVQKDFAKIGLGVAIVPDFAVGGEAKDGTLSVLKIKNVPKRQVGTVIRKTRSLSLAAKTFLAKLGK